jgi:hypothetical protein
MKNGLFTIFAAVFLCLVYFLNTKIKGAAFWKGSRIQPRFSDRFPLVPTTDSQKERKNPVRWLWALAQLFVIVLLLIWFLHSVSK